MKQLIVYEKCQEEENGFGGAQRPIGIGRGEGGGGERSGSSKRAGGGRVAPNL